jgi:hypothetical protein
MVFDPLTIGGVFNSLKSIIDLAKNANDAQLALKISSEFIDAQGKLFDFQQQALAVQVENQRLQLELQRYKTFVFHHSVNWRALPGETEDGPFCPVCLAQGVEMRLYLRSPHIDGKHLNFQCQKIHPGPNTREPNGATYHILKELIPEDRYAQNSS